MNICMYFQVHQPRRLRDYGVFDIGDDTPYFDEQRNKDVMRKVARKCYLPANKALLDALNQHPDFTVAFSITGTALEQFEQYAPDVLDSFKQLADTGQVEFLAETYHHSLSFLYSRDEFQKQVRQHEHAINKHFDQEPTVFRNTELIYNDDVADAARDMGYDTVLAEGVDDELDWRSPNYLYTAANQDTNLLLKNYKLSDDIAFRFSNEGWDEHPLTVEKYAHWLSNVDGDVINLFMDYETFGEHHWEDTGILAFLHDLPGEVLKSTTLDFITPSQASQLHAHDTVSMPDYTSWADQERDLSAWRGNNIQHAALEQLYAVEDAVKNSGDKQLLEDWRRLTTSDHFYYMCIKWFNDGDVHKYFNPFDTPYQAYIAFMNVLNDITHALNDEQTLTERPGAIVQ